MRNISVQATVFTFESSEVPASDGRYIFWLIVNIIVFLFGVPGNCLILCVYWTKTPKTSTHVLIMALAWADLVVCIIRLFDLARVAFLLAGNQIPYFLNAVSLLESLGISGSLFVTALIAADRYDRICRPHTRFFSCKRGKRAAWIALLFAFIITIPECITVFTNSHSPTIINLIYITRVSCFVTVCGDCPMLLKGLCDHSETRQSRPCSTIYHRRCRPKHFYSTASHNG